MKKRMQDSNRKYFIRVLLLLFVLTVGLLGAESVFAQSSTTLKPGDTYNLGKAGKNTSVYINKPGTYTLKGTTRYVRVVICCADVKCYLDDVNMNAGVYTYTGQKASPLNIVDDGGTVTLISKKGTKNYFEGYGMPAIRKQGTNTELVFKTEDPDHPGEIECLGGVWGSAAIGSTSEVQFGKKKCGNFTFESGKVIARSKGGGAAIGGGSCVDGKYFKIKGGEVRAYGSNSGAGIGGGECGYGSNIEITGGKVYAETGYDYGAAAIGGGGGSSGGDSKGVGAYNIYLKGGDITAISHGGGAAIGGGKNQGVSCLYLNGGTIRAKSTDDESVAIGAGYGKYLHADIHIKGGNITAQGGKNVPAIGARKPNLVDDNTVRIEIRGGNITAKGGSSSDWDIGGGRDDMETTITGGTVYAKGIQGRAVITGGSVYANEIQEGAKNDEDAKLHRVDVQFQGLDEGIPIGKLGYNGGKYSYGMNDVVTMEDGYFYPWFPKNNDQISLRTAYAKKTSSSETAFYGSIPFSDKSGVLKQATEITLKTAGYQEGKAGSANGVPGEKHLLDVTMPEIPSKSVAEGYYADPGLTKKVADMDGKLEPNVSGYTNASGEWDCTAVNPTFYCKARQFQYSIHFDPNPPKNASTKGNLSGSMADKTGCNYSEPVTLPGNGFILPGYTFDGWNTKADGTGTRYTDQDDTVKGLSDKDGGKATLYAQWKPKKYRLTLDPGDAGGSQVLSEDMTFDASVVIPDVPEGWAPEYKSFHCWRDKDGKLYDAGDNATNLCDLDANGDPQGHNLTAVWIEHGKIAVTITRDGQPVSGMNNCFKLLSETGTEYDPEMEYVNGVYVFDSAEEVSGTDAADATPANNPDTKPSDDLDAADNQDDGAKISDVTSSNDSSPGDNQDAVIEDPEVTSSDDPKTSPSDDSDIQENGENDTNGSGAAAAKDAPKQVNKLDFGKYTLFFDTETDEYIASSAKINFEKGKTESVVFDYYTVSIEADPANSGISSVAISPAGGLIIPVTNNTVNAPDDTELVIETAAAEGYHFDGYSVLGVMPKTKGDSSGGFDPSKPKQTIVVQGAAAIMAHAEANVYEVHFDANAESGVTGEMENQDMVYDTAQNLFANQYERIGGVFTGWNTEKDGSGTSFEDRASVKNLTQENGGTAKLYAQWNMQQYDITYDLDGGQLPGDALNPEKYTAADTFTLINPEKKDHIFMGWIGTDIDDRTKTVTVPVNSTGDREYIACWTPIQYYVYFESNGGSYVEPEIVIIHDTATKPENPVRAHYAFAGWYADDALTQPYDFSQEITEDITLYAKWEHITHSITYDLNGGTLDGKTGKIVVEANEGDTIKVMKAPTRKGYTFKYWKGSKYNPGDNYLVEKDHTLTAEWKKNKNPSTDDPDDPNNPKNNGGTSTGDDSQILIWTMLMTLSLIGLTVTALARRRHNR